MKIASFFVFAAGLAAAAFSGFAEAAAGPRKEPLQQSVMHWEVMGSGRDQLTLNVSNSGPRAAALDVPAGLVYVSASGERVVALCAASVQLEPESAAEALLPAAALSSKKSIGAAQAWTSTGEIEPRLTPLLSYLATRPDVPRATSQLAVLALTEDIAFAAWRRFVSPDHPAVPTPAEVTLAIDALGILREIAPEKIFALAADPELKLRALRNPWSRAKAMQLYGMTLPGEPRAPAGAAPDLGQLLHTKAGDNCPTCRLRKPPESDF